MDEAAIAVMAIGLALLFIALLSWQLPYGSQLQLAPGEVAPHDVVAPRQITYESQVLTEQARDRAGQTVADQYDSADARIRRQQVDRSREMHRVHLGCAQRRVRLAGIADRLPDGDHGLRGHTGTGVADSDA